jgi:uncharacterized protein
MTRHPACPICKRPVPKDAVASGPFPFCSKRCADTDLLRWLKGGYAIPAGDEEEAASPEGEGEEGTVPRQSH